MQIIPAIDIIDGKCVRLTQGDYTQMTIYNDDPLEVAKMFEDAGLQRLHLVDLDGAKAGAVTNWKVLESVATHTNLVIDFGGGIKQEKDIEAVLNSGAHFATIGSLAVKSPDIFESWIEKYGASKFLLGADVKDEKIAVGGWLEITDKAIIPFIQQYVEKGIQQVFCTDISKDGKLEGPSIVLYNKIITEFSDLFFIASGGVGCFEDVLALERTGCKGVIIGKAIYEGRITLQQLLTYNS
jgi:phosphoribosylformimino-5-aminoimidazole carboxamide ribotide isomerase